MIEPVDSTESAGQEIKRRGRIDAIAADISGIGAAAFDRAGFIEPRLLLHWADIAGQDTAQLCLPVRLSGGVLTLKAEPGAAVFLQYETRTLAERINSFLGRKAVTRLKFLQGPLYGPKVPRPHKADAQATKEPVEMRADDPARGFTGPEELRGALIRLARTRMNRTPRR